MKDLLKNKGLCGFYKIVRSAIYVHIKTTQCKSMCPTRDCIRNMREMVTARQHSYSTAYILYHCKLILFSNMYVNHNAFNARIELCVFFMSGWLREQFSL